MNCLFFLTMFFYHHFFFKKKTTLKSMSSYVIFFLFTLLLSLSLSGLSFIGLVFLYLVLLKAAETWGKQSRRTKVGMFPRFLIVIWKLMFGSHVKIILFYINLAKEFHHMIFFFWTNPFPLLLNYTPPLNK